MDNMVVVGLTGSFDSGCHTIYKYLTKRKGFKGFSLSNKIRKIADREKTTPTRNNLQNIGDDLRKRHGLDYLAKDIFGEIKGVTDQNIVIKSIRNDHEARFFKNKIANFYLINIDAPNELRWKRETKKEKTEFTRKEDFDKADERDTGENEQSHGQHVKKCVDLADIIVNNIETKKRLYEKINRYLKLINSPGFYPPTEEETSMAQAYFWSLQSRCLKRKVGAIIVKNGYTIASGFNDTPSRIIIKKGKQIELKIPICQPICFRDLNKQCYRCKTPITFIFPECKKCKTPLNKDQKEVLSKHLDLCRAIHAEERAILQTAKFGGQSLENTAIYITTFPCQLCAKKIIEVGISKVVYIDPYPYSESYKMLRDAKIELKKFEGVKSQKFDNLYVSIV